jgi:hypothetical protein
MQQETSGRIQAAGILRRKRQLKEADVELGWQDLSVQGAIKSVSVGKHSFLSDFTQSWFVYEVG